MPSKESVNNFDESDVENDEISKKAKENYAKTNFVEKITKYVKYDELMKKEIAMYREKMNTLKEEKNELEMFILRYLDVINQDIVNMGDGSKLTKYESVRKSGLNEEIIKKSIYEQLKSENLISDDNKLKQLTESTFNLMQNKREIKRKVCLKRIVPKQKKIKGENKINL